MSFRSFFHRSETRRNVRRVNRRHAARRLRFETFEDRRMLSFTPAGSYGAGASPQAIVAADFNHDGRLDLATANTGGNTVSVLLGNEGGTFQQAKSSAAGDNPVSLAVGDFNDDGTLDLAAADGSAKGVNVMFGNRDGTFRAPAHIPAGWTQNGERKPGSLATGDFNGDGRMDLVVTSNYGHDYYSYPQGIADVLLAVGDGSFAAPRTYWAYNRALGSAVVAYMNDDPYLDLVTEMPDYSSVLVLLGDGQGNLGGGSVGASSTNPSAAGDLNGDGKTDIVSAPRWYDFPGTVGVMLGDGEGGISYYPDYNSIGGITSSAILGDFDRDGSLDIAAAITDGSVSILRNEGNGTGTFGAAELFAVGQSGSPTTSGDFNLDGIINAADYVVWRKNDGTPDGYNAWRAHFGQSVIPAATPYAVATGDFNGDGWLDLATANAEGSVSVLLNDQTWSQVLPTLAIGSADVTEGNTGTTNATFTVTLSRASNLDVTVHYNTADYSPAAGAAEAGVDYVAESGTLTIPAGETSRTFTVEVIGDRLVEGYEYFNYEYFGVELSAPTNATIKDGSGYGRILDDEPRISITGVAKLEGRSNRTTLFTFTVTLSAAYDQPVTMSYRTVDGTATTSDNDYIAKTGTLSFAPGETTKTITIEVKGDNKQEDDEYFTLDLFDNSENSLIANFSGFGTILNDD